MKVLKFLYGALLLLCFLTEEGRCTSPPPSKFEESFSLFFTPQEIVDLEKESVQKVVSLPQQESSICLQALFYSGTDLWSLWINGEQYSSLQKPKFLKILAVSAYEVHFQASFEQKLHDFTLKPHQCYSPAQKHIREM